MTNEILNKKIELFVDNGIDKYRRFDEIKIIDMIKIYLENNGFFIVMNKTSNFVGYLDLADMKKIKNIYDEINNYKNKTIKELIEDKEIILRTEKIDSNTPLIDVLKKLIEHPKTIEGMKDFKKDAVLEYQRISGVRK